MKRLSSLAFAILAFSPLSVAAPVPLFDGKTLEGWEGETTKTWRVRDGAIVGGSLEGNPDNQFLATKKAYQNFLLRVEYKLVGTEGFINGGVQFRSQRVKNPSNEMRGYQADIGAGYSGSLYDESRRNKVLVQADKALIEKLEKPGDWNIYEIRCEGPRIRLTLNGTQTVDFTETDAGIEPDGLIALQIHAAAKSEISFRSMVIEELPADGATPTLSKMPNKAPEPMNRFAPDTVTPPVTTPFPGGKFTLGENETVVFTGGTNFVREAKSGELEALLTKAFAKQKPVFRSMAVDADTVYLQERELNFGTWRQQLEAVGATVVIAQFGQMEALDGVAKLPEFVAAYHRLLDEFSARTVRIVLVSPMLFDKPPTPQMPDLTKRNDDVRAYAEAVRAIAKQRNIVFVRMIDRQGAEIIWKPGQLTTNGIHLTDQGQAQVATIIQTELGIEASELRKETNIPPFQFPYSAPSELHAAIVAKNRLWSQCWRPANWNFAYGDRATQPFARPAGGQPDLKGAFAQHRALLAEADARIAAIANGEKAPAPPPAYTPPTDEKPLTPEEQLATFTVADGYEVTLVASEKDGVVKPVQISWDERGRMLVACSPSYPHLEVGAPPHDFVLMADMKDGKVSKAWRYADGLTMVNGMEPGDGGIFVCDYDELLHFRDTNNDGKADQRRVVLSGFGIGDTHQLINSINHGDDGSLWFAQGLHVLSHVETPWGIARLDQAAIWRLRPRTLRLEGFFNHAKSAANCWGVVTDDWGNIFHKAGDRPDGYYSQPGLVRAATGFTPSDYHPIGGIFKSDVKTVSIDLLGSKALPDNAQGCAVIAGFMASKVEMHRMFDDGSGFRSEQLPVLLRSSNNAFRPVDVSQGPDGAIYVADFYNPIIGHYQASYRDPKRDKTHGRIWRISAKGRPSIQQPDLSKMDAPALLEQLGSPERWTRYQAQRVLFWKPTDEVVKALDAWTAKVTDEALLRGALGIYEAHETARPELLKRLLASKDARVRAYATRMAGMWSDRMPEEAIAHLKERAADPDARVRLEAIVAATYVAKPEAVEITAIACTKPRDKFIDYAITQSINALKPQWQPAFASLTFGGDAAQRAFVQQIGGAVPPPPHPGKTVYDSLCMNCHQPDAKGLPKIYPPLAGSEWVNGDKAAPIKMLLHGLAGPITVKGEPFGTGNPIPMPPSGLDDQKIADVLTYVRANFGNTASAITADEVRMLREQHKARTALWTVPELTPAK
jgi:mono/diheme cytochrome c family protein/glucose/arabinose dehydrogenase